MNTSARLLPNYLAGRWQTGSGPGALLRNPVLRTEWVRVSNGDLDLAEGFAFACEQGGRAMSYRERAGGGEELGGLRALNFYHRRSAIQASTAALAQPGAAV
ncbi:MAG: hypothetical protein ABI040_05860 [Rhodoferax sp.]